jgi:hypothetical protein
LIRIKNPGDANYFMGVFRWHLKDIAIQVYFI